MADINFDGLFDRFQRNIYGGEKGLIRERLVKHHLVEYLPAITRTPMACADVGGGLGQMTHWLLSQGHHVDYCDLSKKMTQQAQKTTAKEYVENVRFFSGPFQEKLHGQYDLVHCQAVLEWLEAPYDGLQRLCQLVQPQGYLVLLFYNKTCMVLRNLIRGNLNAAFNYRGGDGIGLTPINPLEIDDVFTQLDSLGMSIQHWFGIRTFTDYQEKPIRQRLGVEALYEYERPLSTQDPYRSLARYIGVICQNTLTP